MQATRDLLKLITAVLEVDQEHDGTTYTYGDLCIRDPLNECKSTG